MTPSTNTLNGDSEVDEVFLQIKFVNSLHRFHVETFN
jgi:hypothetical protein